MRDRLFPSKVDAFIRMYDEAERRNGRIARNYRGSRDGVSHRMRPHRGSIHAKLFDASVHVLLFVRCFLSLFVDTFHSHALTFDITLFADIRISSLSLYFNLHSSSMHVLLS